MEDQGQKIDLFSVIGHKQIEIDMLKAQLEAAVARIKELEGDDK